MEGVRLNDARGDFAGGTLTVAGDQIKLTYDGGISAMYGSVGPTAIKNCRPDMCQVGGETRPPWVMSVFGDVVVAANPFTPDTCGAPAVPDEGLVTITPDLNRISFVTGDVNVLGGSCADGSSWHAVWTQVLTRAP